MLELNKIYFEDCVGINGMCLIPDKSIDMILCDLPYGTTRSKWDSIIDFNKLWSNYNRIIKDNGAIVLNCSFPFTGALWNSNKEIFRYSYVWKKSHSTGHLNANRMPMREHEDILVFYKQFPTFNPQKTKKENKNIRTAKRTSSSSNCYGKFNPNADATDTPDVKFPSSILEFDNSTTSSDKGLHVNQKPLEMGRYFIKTYSNENDIILDNTCGSGTYPLAALIENRNFIAFENDEEIFQKAEKRIKQHQQKLTLF